jgi:CspA family cold shock protein
MPELTVGTVVFFDTIRGFGFVKCDRGGPDVFVSKSELLNSEIKILNAGMRLAFRLHPDPRGRRSWASDLSEVTP